MAHLTHANVSEIGDVDTHYKSKRFIVIAGPTLRSTGWRGGQFVQYIDSDEGDFVVEASDGNLVAGFILFPSENYDISWQGGGFLGGDGVGSNANWTGGQPATGVGGQNVVTMVRGSTRAMFKVYETRQLDGGTRTGAAITYTLHDALKVSENGLLTNDSDVDLATVGIADPVVVGKVSAVPAARNFYRLGIDF